MRKVYCVYHVLVVWCCFLTLSSNSYLNSIVDTSCKQTLIVAIYKVATTAQQHNRTIHCILLIHCLAHFPFDNRIYTPQHLLSRPSASGQHSCTKLSSTRLASAAIVLLVYQPPNRKSVVLYTLSVGLLRAFISSLRVALWYTHLPPTKDGIHLQADLARALSIPVRHLQNPSQKYVSAVHHLWRCMYVTRHLAICYRPDVPWVRAPHLARVVAGTPLSS
jgi:hypothetical protein